MDGDASPTLRVAQGELRGRKAVGAWGNTYFAFHGIPYAAPPVGPLRFKPPQPAAAWTGVRDATKEGNVSVQMNMMTGQLEGDEDCLVINVYTPRLPSKASGNPLPVMFLVHGGGFQFLSGNEQWSGPDFLLRHDVIMVSFNYRLSVLGFLSTGDSVVPGNMGLKDQVAALRWVRDNIASFGGDPNNVTIFGYSAGAISCHALMLSPLAKGLFRRAIAQSGVITGDGLVTDLVRERSFRLASHLGCKTNDSREMVNFMRNLPAKVLVENSMFSRSEEDVARGVMFPFVGIVEPADAEGGPFMSRPPSDVMSSRDFQSVPFIAGVCAFEGTAFLGAQLLNPKLPFHYAADPKLLIPTNLPCGETDIDAVAEEIRRFYFGNRDISPETAKEICELMADVVFNYPAVKAVQVHSSKTPAATYFYLFDVIKELIKLGPLAEIMSNFMKPIGGAAMHGAECGYIFRSAFFEDPAPKEDSPEGKLIAKMTRIWSNFAKHDQPTDPELGVTWPPFTAESAAYLKVDQQGFSVGHRPFKERFAFWDALYSRYGG